MKNITLFVFAILCFGLTSNQAIAQEGYTYALEDNGAYSFTISAVPNASISDFATSVQSYGFAIIVPDGVTITIMSSLGSSAGATPFDGSNVGMPVIDGYLISETLGAPINLVNLPSSGTPTPMVTIQVNGSPTAGDISLLANNSSLATTVTALKCFMSADMVDDGTAVFPPVVDAVGSGLSGTTSYSFSTLGIENFEIPDFEVSVYPNPTKDSISIRSRKPILIAKLFDVTGKQVMVVEEPSKLSLRNLPAGIYLLKLFSEHATVVKRIVKQ